MTEPTIGKYTFLPWLKTGLGTLISNDEQTLVGPRAKIQVNLSVKAFKENNEFDPKSITKELLLYGPGDITAIMSGVIIRTAPGQNELNVEPNFFPHVEFSQPDFPWRYTPAVPTAKGGRLSPWISLIVLKQSEFEFETPLTTEGTLPCISINSINQPLKKYLPDLTQSWATAHTQVTQDISSQDNTLGKILIETPYKVISRILSLRKLEPNNLYFAFLVPTFKVGRMAGLEDNVGNEEKGTLFAWNIEDSPSERFRIPVYYQWRFTTSPQEADFESLILKLQPRNLSENIGLRKLDVSEPFLSFGKEAGALGLKKPVYIGGALLSSQAREKFNRKGMNVHNYSIPVDPENPSNVDPENPSNEEIKKFIMKMKEIIDLPERASWTFVRSPFHANEDPIISPPMYGRWHSKKKLVSKISDDYSDPDWIDSVHTPQNELWFNKLKDDSPYKWLEELNLDPTNRVAAGLGTAVVQKIQEELMESAWDQAGSLNEVNKRYRSFQLARTISVNVYERYIKQMDPSVLIKLVSPFHSKVKFKQEGLNKNMRISKMINDSPIQNAIFSPSFTKISARRGKIHRKLFKANNDISVGLLNRLNKGGLFLALDVKPKSLLTIDFLVNSPPLQRILHGSLNENDFGEFKGKKLDEYLNNHPQDRDMVKNIENSIPPSVTVLKSVVSDDKLIGNISETLKEALNPIKTIELKAKLEIIRPERLQEDEKDILDPVIAYPQFKLPMFQPLRDLSEDLVLPGVKDIPPNTIGVLVPNLRFIYSYMVGLNHEMARELLWREYPTDQRGSYFRQFWDASAAINKEILDLSPVTDEQTEAIIEKYRDIPEIHKWKDSALEEIHRWKDSTPEDVTVATEDDKPVLLIKGDLLLRYPNAVIYASTTAENDPAGKIKLPVFRGTIPPDITFLGFDISIEELRGSPQNNDPGYFFIIQEQPSEPRFGIDFPEDPSIDPSSLPELESWDKLDWNYVKPLPESNYIDLESGRVKDNKPIATVKWGSHAADLANILLQQPVRIAVHARELLKQFPSKVEGVSITVVSSTQLNLSWTQNKESNIKHYNIYRGISSGFSVNPDTALPVGSPTTNAFADTGLIASTTYYYRVAAVDNAGNVGDLSSEQSGSTSGPS